MSDQNQNHVANAGGGEIIRGVGDYSPTANLLKKCRPVRGRVIILADPLEATYGDGGIIKPDAFKDELRMNETGIILAIGAPQITMQDETGILSPEDLPPVGAHVVYRNNVQYGDYRRVVCITQDSILGVIEL